MPTHIYTRLGDWDGVIRGNLRAAEAALKYPAGDKKQYVWDEFPHAIEYLIYGYLQKGQDNEAAAQLKSLRETKNLEPSFKTAFHLASTQARYALERRAWEEAAKIVPRQPASLDWDKFAWPEAIAWFAQGLGQAHLGKVDDAKAAAERLAELATATGKSGEELFARNIQILRLELEAWRAHAEKREGEADRLMGEAVELELSTPKAAVTPGPTLPALELMGDLLMEQNQPAEALVSYRRSLKLYPKRFNSLLGAARAAHASRTNPARAPTTRSYSRSRIRAAAKKFWTKPGAISSKRSDERFRAQRFGVRRVPAPLLGGKLCQRAAAFHLSKARGKKAARGRAALRKLAAASETVRRTLRMDVLPIRYRAAPGGGRTTCPRRER